MLELLGLPVYPVEHYYQLARMEIAIDNSIEVPNNLYSINMFVNRYIKYKKDYADHWQSPKETLELMSGDCEDYAILKYAILKKFGREAYLVLVPNHMIVVVDGYVLDNKTDKIIKWEQYNWHPLTIYTYEVTYSFTENKK